MQTRETFTRFNLRSSQDESFHIPMSAESGCFSGLFFPAGLDPIDPHNPYKPLKGTSGNGAELLRSQADTKWVERGPFPHVPCSQLPPHTRPESWCRRKGLLGGASSWVAVALLLFQPFFFAGELHPSTSTDFPELFAGIAPCWAGASWAPNTALQPGQAPTSHQNHCSLLTAGHYLPRCRDHPCLKSNS